jgi:competence protein ComEC
MAYGELLVDFWEVGQGDCTVIHLPSGQLILIDVGPLGSPVVEWLARQPGYRIHSIIITHNDSDHAGSLTSLVECCRKRIGSVFVMADRNVHDPKFRDLFRRVDQAWKAKEIDDLRRLEAPMQIWPDSNSPSTDNRIGLSLNVRHPTLSANVLSGSPNETSSIITLTSLTSETILWAGDTTIENVAAVATGSHPAFMLGPHHGAPEDRQKPQFPALLKSVSPHTIVASVGTGNRYDHPCVSYIKHAKRAGASFTCTQLTKNCEKPGRLHTVFNGAAYLGLPQTRKGFACRGTFRLTFNGTRFVTDPLADAQHLAAVQKLARPKCTRSY